MIPSPCQQLCVLEPASGHCIGCGRSSEEIAAWTRLDDRARLAIVEDLPRRVAAMRVARIARHGERRGRGRRSAGAGNGGTPC
jgi:hypothetical protein